MGVLPTAESKSAGASFRRSTWWILSAGLLARLAVVWVTIARYPHQWLFSRGIEMGLLADSLLHGLGYSSPFGGSTGPTAFIAPGYPTLVAVIFYLFGIYSFPSAIAIMLLQVAVSLLTIWLMMWIAREVFGDGTAGLAGFVWALSIPLLFIPTIFWDTSLSACALAGVVALALRSREGASARGWVLLGVYCAAVALINPALLFVLVAVLGWIAFRTRKMAGWRPLLGVAALVLAFAPWPIRNVYRFHAFIPLRSTVGFELWMGNRSGATGYLDESVFPMYNKRELASYVTKGEATYTKEKMRDGREYILAHPIWFFWMSLKRFYRFWMGAGNARGSIFYAIHAGVTTLLGFAGIGMLYRRRMWGVVSLFSFPLLVFPIPYYMTHAEFRYRLVVDPILTILASYAVLQMAHGIRTMRAQSADSTAPEETAELAACSMGCAE